MTSSKIAILQTAFLGDTLLAIPLAKYLFQRGHRLALVCRRGYGSLFLATKLFDNVIEVEKGSSASYRAAEKSLDSWWADSGQRILISPHESPRSKMFALNFRLRAHAAATVGYSDRGLMRGLSFAAYTNRVARPLHLAEAVRQLALLQSTVFGSEEAELWKSRISEATASQDLSGGRLDSGALAPVPDWASMKVDALKAQQREKIVVLAPGSVWRTKQWTEQGFAEVGRRLVELGREIKVTGSKDEAELCQRLALAIGPKARSIAGEASLLETVHEIARAEIAIVNDSGSMHLAALVGTPTVAVFGPTVLDFGYRPWSNNARVVEPGPLPCRPCGLHGSQVCPIGTHVCMTMTTADQVLREVETLLA